LRALAIREVIDAYAFCADRRDARGQMALFTTDTRFLVYICRFEYRDNNHARI
jgi:hypothetical protein